MRLYWYDFSKLVCMLSIAIHHTNFVPRVSLFSGQQQEGPTALGDMAGFKSKSRTHTQSCTRSPNQKLPNSWLPATDDSTGEHLLID